MKAATKAATAGAKVVAKQTVINVMAEASDALDHAVKQLDTARANLTLAESHYTDMQTVFEDAVNETRRACSR